MRRLEMNTLSGVAPSGVNQADTLAKISERFEAFDSDMSGTLSKTEISDYRSARGLDTSRIDKVFDWLDVDGNGDVSQQEHEQRLMMLAERAQGHTRPDNYANHARPDSNEGFGALKTLFETIDTSLADDEQMDQVQRLRERIEAEGYSRENLSSMVSFLSEIIPRIDSTA